MKTYQVKVVNAVPNASFSLYLNDYERRVLGGHADGEEFIMNVPVELEGKGKLKIFYKRKSRAFQTIAYSVPLEIYHDKKNVVDFSDMPVPAEPKEAPPKPEPIKEPSANSENDEPSDPISEAGGAVDEIKEATDNELREDAIDTIEEVTDNKLRDKIDEKKTGNSFWDNLK